MTHIEERISQACQQASSNPFEDVLDQSYCSKEEQYDIDDLEDVFFGAVITREEMRVIKKRGLGGKKRKTMELIQPAQIEALNDPLNGTTLSLPDQSPDSEAALQVSESMNQVQIQGIRDSKILVTRSGRLIRPTILDQKSRITAPVDLNKTTLTNTKHNSGYHFVQINYKDIFEPGPRPPSPSSHVKKLQNDCINDACTRSISPISFEVEQSSNRKPLVKWSKDLVQRIKMNEQTRFNPTPNITCDLKSCLKQPKQTNSEDTLKFPTQKPIVNVRRVYYEDDEQLKYLLTSVPTLLDQVLGNSVRAKRKVFDSWRIGGDLGMNNEQDDVDMKDDLCSIQSHVNDSKSYQAQSDIKHIRKKPVNHSTSTMGPPQRNGRV